MSGRRRYGAIRKLPSGRWQVRYRVPTTNERRTAPFTFPTKGDASRWLAVLEVAGVPYYYDREDQRLRVRPGYHFPAVNLSDGQVHTLLAYVTAVSGLILIVMGTLILTNELTRLNSDAQDFLGNLGLDFIYNL